MHSRKTVQSTHCGGLLEGAHVRRLCGTTWKRPPVANDETTVGVTAVVGKHTRYRASMPRCHADILLRDTHVQSMRSTYKGGPHVRSKNRVSNGNTVREHNRNDEITVGVTTVVGKHTRYRARMPRCHADILSSDIHVQSMRSTYKEAPHVHSQNRVSNGNTVREHNRNGVSQFNPPEKKMLPLTS